MKLWTERAIIAGHEEYYLRLEVDREDEILGWPDGVSYAYRYQLTPWMTFRHVMWSFADALPVEVYDDLTRRGWLALMGVA